MIHQIQQDGITFVVDDVVPASKPLRELRMYELLRRRLGKTFESCSDYHQEVVDGHHYHALLEAVYLAFNEHRPLVLSPDAVWITITQGVAHHMAAQGEALRDRFVAHQGRL